MKVSAPRHILRWVLALGLALFTAAAAAGAETVRGSEWMAAAPAATFTVTTTADSGAGSLRWAIEQANAAAGLDTIAFNIAGAGVKTIAPLTILPTITDAVIVDGATQPGFAGAPLIELSGASCAASPCHGLWITAGGSTVKGLIINRFPDRGILLETGGGNTIVGNYLGSDSAGTAAAGNNTGIYVSNSADNFIGGASDALRNLISGNSIDGITLIGTGSTANYILGNYIGVDVTGASGLANGSHGIELIAASFNKIGSGDAADRNTISGNQGWGIAFDSASDSNAVYGNYVGTSSAGTAGLGNAGGGILIMGFGNTIGSGDPGGGNVISANGSYGVEIVDAGGVGSGDANSVFGNIIGADASGARPLGNQWDGVFVYRRASGNMIGGFDPGRGNVIAFNGHNGVLILAHPIYGAPQNNSVHGNAIFENYDLGIDLARTWEYGITRNDSAIDDISLLPNTYQNYPVITGVTVAGGQTTVQGTLHSKPNMIHTIAVYASARCDPQGAGEGERFLGTLIVTTDANGDAAFSHAFPVALADGATVTAAATDNMFNTSEFSLCQSSNLVVTLRGAPDRVAVGYPLTYHIEVINRQAGAAGNVTLVNTLPAGATLLSAYTAHGVCTGAGPVTCSLGALASGDSAEVAIDVIPGAAGVITASVSVASDLAGASVVTETTRGDAPLTFTVNSADDADDGVCNAAHCSLREAVLAANQHSGVDVIAFNIPTGPLVIRPTSALPDITDPVMVRGDLQPGTTCPQPRLALDGSLAGGSGFDGVNGLTLRGGASLVRGLAIYGFSGSAIAIADGGQNRIACNYLGVDVTGMNAPGNKFYGVEVLTSENTIGGWTVADRNVVAGHSEQAGIAVRDVTVRHNVIAGNYVGVNPAGAAALGNNGGISLRGHLGTVGGTRNVTPVGPCTGACNLIAGNNTGITIGDRDNRVWGNFIGATPDGTATISNTTPGITPYGIYLFDGASYNRIGGGAAATRNLIARNQTAIYIEGGSSSSKRAYRNIIAGNYIGVDVSGLAPLGDAGMGIHLYNSFVQDTQIIGNVIAAGGGHGLYVQWGPAGTIVRRNLFGVGADGVTPLGNTGDAIYLDPLYFADSVPRTEINDGNIIAHSAGNGITVVRGKEILIEGNSIHSNGGLGIDLGNDGVTANDPGDADTGPNLLQNYPALAAAATDGATLTITGTLNTISNTATTIQVYFSPSCDPAGYGEGQTYLGSFAGVTDGGGQWSFVRTLPVAAPADAFVTATATDGAGNTSEFSACVAVQEQPVVCTPGPHSGAIAADEAWCAADSPHLLTGDVTVTPGVTLTVKAGAVVKGNSNTELKVQGRLVAIGAAARPITFTSAADTAANQWSGLIFDGGAGDLNHTTVRYGGNLNSLNANCNASGLGFNIAVRNVLTGELRLRNSQVLSERYLCNNWNVDDYGLYVDNSHVTVDNTLFQGNGNDGSDYPLYVFGANSVLTLTNSIFTANARQRVLFGGSVLSTWDAVLTPQAGLEGYELAGDMVIPAEHTWTLQPGAVLMGRDDVEIKVQGRLNALGAPAQPITFTSATNTGPAQWSGLVFDGSAALTTGGGAGYLRYATVRYGGDPNSLNGNCNASGLGFNIAARNVTAGELRLEHSQVLSERYLCNNWNVEDYGLYVDNSHVVVSDTLFQANGNDGSDYPIYVQGADSTLALTGNTFAGNPRNRVLLAAGALLSADVRLEDESGLESYELESDYVVPAGRTLTVDPGVVVMGRSNVELRTLGHLSAIGTAGQPITFTSATDTGPNQWSGLIFDGAAGGGAGDLRYATVRYGGNANSLNANCNASGLGFNIAARNVLTGELRLEHSQVLAERYLCNNWNVEDYGLYVVNSHVVVSDTLFQANGNDGSDYPIYVQGADSTLALTDNTFTGNPRNRVLLAAGALLSADVRLEQESGLESYELEADYVVPAGLTLTVDPGVMVMGRSNVELRTLGHLSAIGAAGQPITFTSATNTGANQWSGLVFDGGTGHLRYATVRYGGNVNSLNANCNTSGLGFDIAARNVLTGELRLENSQVLAERYLCNNWQANDYGLYVSNSRVTISNTLFADNGNSSGDYAAYATGAGSVLTFDGNVLRNNVRGLLLNGVAGQTLRNNVIMDNSQGGVNIAAGAAAQLLHTTIARNGGDGLTVANGGSASLVNTILARNVTGVRVNAGGVANLTQTLWDGNTTDTVGTVGQTGALAGPAGFDADGYHITRYSAARDQAAAAGVPADIDGEARPQPADLPPDLGADEYIFGPDAEFVFEKIALSPQWAAAPAQPGGIPSGGLIQRYLLRYYYGSAQPNPPALTVSITDTLPAALTFENETHYPGMSFGQAGSTLTWQTQQPAARGQAGQIEIVARYDNPQPGAALTNTAALHAGPFDLADAAITQVPIVAPLLVAPGAGELCAGDFAIRGQAQPNVIVHLLFDGAEVGQAQADAAGQFTATQTYSGTLALDLTAQACTADGQCSPVSAAITLEPSLSFWCPQHSTWEGTPAVGPLAGRHLTFYFRDNTGQYATQNWRMPGVYGFWNTTLHLRGCNCPAASGTTAPPSALWLIADGVRYDPTGAFPDYTFAVAGGAHTVVFWAQCGANQVSSSGHILIDPDGYVFDVTQGFDPITPTLHAVAGVTVTAYVSNTAWGGWTPWPAHLYNDQVNPQVTAADGYFAFFTPPGSYYLQVEGKAGYQPWRSPVIEVVDQIVHVNVPYTPRPASAIGDVLLTAAGPQPQAVTVTVGSAVQWQVEADGLAPPELLAQQAENPDARPLSALDPISNTVGWDGGMMLPGQAYRRQMATAGLYAYTDGLGHSGQVCVTPLEDVNRDGAVDALDVTAVADRWRNGALYDATYDVAAPFGVIDVLDIITVASYMGQGC